MGDQKRREEAENTESSAVEILKELKEILKVPDGVSVLLFAKSQCVLLSELAFGVRMTAAEDDKWPGYLRTGVYVNPRAPRYVIYQGQSAINEALHRMYMQMDMAEAKENDSGIIVPGNGKSRLQ